MCGICLADELQPVNPPTGLPEHHRAFLDEWCNIPQDQVDNLILSMPRRFVHNRGLKMEGNKEKFRYILQFFFDKGENSSQVTEIVKGVYGADTVTANYMQLWVRRFRSDIFDVKDVLRSVRTVVEDADKITEIIEVDWRVSSRSIAQELKFVHKKSLKPFAQSWIQKEARCLGAPPMNTKKHDGSNFHLRSLGSTK
ncbi:histone-lysine N-methyltransferase SETMAR [Trichonephila clavipes]|nr:histone-lysine N-methyltransferase SETMAR [Trichonephila clavipes]